MTCTYAPSFASLPLLTTNSSNYTAPMSNVSLHLNPHYGYGKSPVVISTDPYGSPYSSPTSQSPRSYSAVSVPGSNWHQQHQRSPTKRTPSSHESAPWRAPASPIKMAPAHGHLGQSPDSGRRHPPRTQQYPNQQSATNKNFNNAGSPPRQSPTIAYPQTKPKLRLTPHHTQTNRSQHSATLSPSSSTSSVTSLSSPSSTPSQSSSLSSSPVSSSASLPKELAPVHPSYKGLERTATGLIPIPQDHTFKRGEIVMTRTTRRLMKTSATGRLTARHPCLVLESTATHVRVLQMTSHVPLTEEQVRPVGAKLKHWLAREDPVHKDPFGRNGLVTSPPTDRAGYIWVGDDGELVSVEQVRYLTGTLVEEDEIARLESLIRDHASDPPSIVRPSRL